MDPDDESQPEEELIGLSEDCEDGAAGSDNRVSAASGVLNRVTSSGTGVSITAGGWRLAVRVSACSGAGVFGSRATDTGSRFDSFTLYLRRALQNRCDHSRDSEPIAVSSA